MAPRKKVAEDSDDSDDEAPVAVSLGSSRAAALERDADAPSRLLAQAGEKESQKRKQAAVTADTSVRDIAAKLDVDEHAVPPAFIAALKAQVFFSSIPCIISFGSCMYLSRDRQILTPRAFHVNGAPAHRLRPRRSRWAGRRRG